MHDGLDLSSTTIARTYSVDPAGNKLLGVTQQITNAAGSAGSAVNYTYNANGDLTGDGLADLMDVRR